MKWESDMSKVELYIIEQYRWASKGLIFADLVNPSWGQEEHFPAIFFGGFSADFPLKNAIEK